MYPVLFQIGGIEFYSNVIVIFIGMIFSAFFMINRLKKNNLSLNFLDDYFFIFTLSFLFFGRIGEILLKSSFYSENPLNSFYFWDGNFSFYFGILGMGLIFMIVSLVKKENFLKWMDALIPAFLVGILFMAFSDFLSGENYGKPTNSFLGMSFDSPEVKYTLPIHPVQLYEFFSVLIIFVFTLIISKKKRFPGVLSSLGLFLFFLTEFLLEFFRAGSEKIIFGYKFSQILFLFLAISFLIFFIIKSHKNINIYQLKKGNE